MPQKNIVIDYQNCEPKNCPDGMCQSALLCKRKILFQEKPFELPEVKASMCLGCALCIKACPMDALRMM